MIVLRQSVALFALICVCLIGGLTNAHAFDADGHEDAPCKICALLEVKQDDDEAETYEPDDDAVKHAFADVLDLGICGISPDILTLNCQLPDSTNDWLPYAPLPKTMVSCTGTRAPPAFYI